MSDEDKIKVWVRVLPSQAEPYTSEDGRKWLAAGFKANVFNPTLFALDEKNLTRDRVFAIVIGEIPDAEAKHFSNKVILEMSTEKARELAQAILTAADPDRN
jgi:hypothetical protein